MIGDFVLGIPSDFSMETPVGSTVALRAAEAFEREALIRRVPCAKNRHLESLKALPEIFLGGAPSNCSSMSKRALTDEFSLYFSRKNVATNEDAALLSKFLFSPIREKFEFPKSYLHSQGIRKP